MRSLLALAAMIVLTGCSTTPSVPPWGSDATLFPGWEKIKIAAIDNVTAPQVWVPLIGAGLLQIGGADQSVSDWASENTPLFGSQQRAIDAGKAIVLVSAATYAASAIAIPIGADREAGLWGKTKGIGFGLLTIRGTKLATDAIKDAAGRERPDGSDDQSFPSSTASIASAQFTLTERNIRHLTESPGIRKTARVGAAAMTYVAGWARVEANKHYLSDVLVGGALGYFIAGFVNDAFIESPMVDVKTDLAPDGSVNVAVELNF